MTELETMLSRMHQGAERERALVSTGYGILNIVNEKAATIRNDGRLSAAGIQARLVEVAIGDHWKNISQLRDQAKTMALEIEASRRTMVPKKPDAADLGAIMHHAELRSAMKGMTRADRLRIARDDDEFGAAALTAHPVLSGFNKDTASDIDIIGEAYARRNHTVLFVGLEMRDEAMDVVNAALQRVTTQICEVAGMTETDIARLSAKEDPDEIDPNNLPIITRADLRDWANTDPGRASHEMRRVFEGKARLID